jgi:hypothetical protein
MSEVKVTKALDLVLSLVSQGYDYPTAEEQVCWNLNLSTDEGDRLREMFTLRNSMKLSLLAPAIAITLFSSSSFATNEGKVTFHFMMRTNNRTVSFDGPAADKVAKIPMPSGFGDWQCVRDTVDPSSDNDAFIGDILCSNDKSATTVAVFTSCSTKESSSDSNSLMLANAAGAHILFVVSCTGEVANAAAKTAPGHTVPPSSTPPVSSPPPSPSTDRTPTINL